MGKHPMHNATTRRIGHEINIIEGLSPSRSKIYLFSFVRIERKIEAVASAKKWKSEGKREMRCLTIGHSTK